MQATSTQTSSEDHERLMHLQGGSSPRDCCVGWVDIAESESKSVKVRAIAGFNGYVNAGTMSKIELKTGGGRPVFVLPFSDCTNG